MLKPAINRFKGIFFVLFYLPCHILESIRITTTNSSDVNARINSGTNDTVLVVSFCTAGVWRWNYIFITHNKYPFRWI